MNQSIGSEVLHTVLTNKRKKLVLTRTFSLGAFGPKFFTNGQAGKADLRSK